MQFGTLLAAIGMLALTGCDQSGTGSRSTSSVAPSPPASAETGSPSSGMSSPAATPDSNSRSASNGCTSRSLPSFGNIAAALLPAVKVKYSNRHETKGIDRVEVVGLASDCNEKGAAKVSFDIVWDTNHDGGSGKLRDSTELILAEDGKWYVERTAEVQP